jgi:predicted RNA-binding Zn ribbon-like protein
MPIPDTLFIGDHPALDLINTVMQVDGRPVDLWQDDAAVLGWLRQAGYASAAGERSAPAGLLAQARALRELVRTLLRERKEGRDIDAAPLNAALAQARRQLVLIKEDDGALRLETRYAGASAGELLAPLAEAAAALLATGDFQLIRACESADCTLWFLDRTKSHRRRWCSMAQCGNRHKVASFRQRQAAAK